ncbi:MFS transporter [Streptomyces sp. NPDC059009]|uniref:MFS transporter n=1 Tax=Streptomyces sp. NPDC059009 TaxID=3346694 RepID=UPI0036754C55
MKALRDVPRTVWLLAAGQFFNMVVAFTFVYFFVYLTHERGLSVAQAGLISGIGGAGMVAGNFTGGWFGDRFGHRRVLLVGSLVSGAGVLALPVLPVALLYVVPVLSQYAGGCVRTANSALVAATVPEGGRRQGFAVMRCAANAGFTAGPPLGALLIAHASYGVMFVVDGVGTLVFAAYAARVLPARVLPARGVAARRAVRVPGGGGPGGGTDGGVAGGGGPDGGVPGGGGPGVFAALRARPTVVLLLAAILVTDLVYRQQYSTLPLDLGHHGLDTAVYGWLLAINGAVNVLLELPVAVALRGRAPLRIVGCGLLLVGAGYGVLAAGTALGTTALGAAVTMMLLLTAGEILYKTTATAYVADHAPAHVQGRFQGLYSGVSVSGVVLSAPLGGALYSVAPGALWPVCAGLAGVAGVFVLLAGRLGAGAAGVSGPEVSGAERPGAERPGAEKSGAEKSGSGASGHGVSGAGSEGASAAAAAFRGPLPETGSPARRPSG